MWVIKLGFRVLLLLVVFNAMLLPADRFSKEKEADDKYELDGRKLFSMSLEDLGKIKVTTAGKREEKIKDIPASVVVITRDEIERYGYGSLEEILKHVPGLYPVNNRAIHGTVFGVRGSWRGWPNSFIVLVNDVEQGGTIGLYHLQNFNLPVEAIDRIEIIRGPMSIMYGSGAFFGAVNIITNQVTGTKPVSVISASMGSQQTKRAALRYAYGRDLFKLVLNAGYYDTYGPDEPLSKMVSHMASLAPFGISAANQNTTTGGRLENNNAYFNLSAKYKSFFADISVNRGVREEYHFWPSFKEGLEHEKKFITVSFGYTKTLFKGLSLKGAFRYYLCEYWREFDYFQENLYGQEMNFSNKYEVELFAILNPVEKFNMVMGFNYKEKDASDKLDIRQVVVLNTGYYTDNIRNLSLFSQVDYSPVKRLKFVAGLRLEKPMKYTFEDFNNEIDYVGGYEYVPKKAELAPRLAMIYSLDKNHILKCLYGRAVKFPVYIENLFQKKSNLPNLETEYITTFEVNYLGTLSARFSLNLSIFHNILDNLVVTMLQFDDEGNWAPTRNNSGKMVTNGAEFMVYAKPFKDFLLELSGTVQKTKDKRPGFENRAVGYSPELLGYVKASYRFNPHMTVAVTGRYIGGMETLWDVARVNGDGSVGGRIGDKVDGYFTLDANLRLNNLLGNGYYINLRCANLFDTDYLYPIYTNNSGWADKGTFGDRRTFLLSVGKRF